MTSKICSDCELYFSDLASHSHVDNHPFTCQFCREMSDKRAEFCAHLRTTHSVHCYLKRPILYFQCDQCLNMLSSKRRLIDHLVRDHQQRAQEIESKFIQFKRGEIESPYKRLVKDGQIIQEIKKKPDPSIESEKSQ